MLVLIVREEGGSDATFQMSTAAKHQGRGKDRVHEMSVMFPMTKHLKLKNKKPDDQVLKMVQTLPKTEDWKLTVSKKCFDEAMREFAKAENELVAKLNSETQKRLNTLKCQMEEDHVCVYKSCLETSVKDMDGMTDEYNKLRSFVMQSDASLDELKKERDRLQLQVKELTDKIHGMMEQDEAIMAAVDAKVEEWKQVFSKKDEESLRYHEEVQKRDIQIKMLKKDKELLLATRQRKMEELKSKLEAAESRAAEAEQALKVAKDHAEEEEKAFNEVLVRLRQYESGSLSLDAALAEIKQCSNQIKDMTEEKRSSVVLEKDLRLLDAKFQAKVCELSKVRQDQETLLRDILQSIRTKQQLTSFDGDVRLGGRGDWTSNPAQQVKSKILQLVEKNQELNQKLKQAHEEATRSFSQLSDAKEKLHTTCKSFFSKLEEKEAALSEAEDNIKSRDKVINELRDQLLTASTQEQQLSDSIPLQVFQSESHRTLKLAQQTIKDLHSQLDKKENVIKKIHKQAEQNQKEMREKYREELGRLEQKLTSHMDSSLGCFKQQAQELMDMSTFEVPNGKQVERLKEIVDEQECSLISLTEELRLTSGELEQHRVTLESQAKKHADEVSRMEVGHAAQVQALTGETVDLRGQVVQMEKEINHLRSELEAQNEANACAASSLEAGKLKAQVVHKDKQIKRLSKVLLEMRAEMTSAAEQRVREEAAKQQDNLNVQLLIDKHTKYLEVQAQELGKELQAAKKSERTARSRANTLKQEVDTLSQKVQSLHKKRQSVQAEMKEREEEVHELEQQNKRLSSALQKLQEQYGKGLTIENLQKRIRRLELDLERAQTKNYRGNNQSSSTDSGIRSEEGTKWQTKLNKVTHLLMEKENENELLSKKLGAFKNLCSKLERENATLQKKLQNRGLTPNCTTSCVT